MVSVAKSLFQTGADDKLITVDAYNKTVEQYKPLEKRSKEGVGPSKSDVSSEEELQQKKKEAEEKVAAFSPSKAESPEALMASLSELTGGGSALSGLEADEKDAVDKAINDAKEAAEKEEKTAILDTGLGASTAITPHGEINIDPANGAKVKGGLKIFANLFGDSFLCGALEEAGKLRAALKALFDLSLDIEIQECLSDILKDVKSDSTRFALLQEAGDNFAKKGQVDGLDKVFEELGPDVVSLRNKDLVKVTLKNYKRPNFVEDENDPSKKRPVTKNDDPILYAKMDNTLTKADPHWGYYERDGEWVPDSEVWGGLSQEAKEVVSTNRDNRMNVAVAEAHYPTSRRFHVLKHRGTPVVRV